MDISDWKAETACFDNLVFFGGVAPDGNMVSNLRCSKYFHYFHCCQEISLKLIIWSQIWKAELLHVLTTEYILESFRGRVSGCPNHKQACLSNPSGGIWSRAVKNVNSCGSFSLSVRRQVEFKKNIRY